MKPPRNLAPIRRVLRKIPMAGRHKFTVALSIASLTIICAGYSLKDYGQGDSEHARVHGEADTAPAKLPPTSKPATCADCIAGHHNQAETEHVGLQSNTNSARTMFPSTSRSADNQPNVNQSQSSRPTVNEPGVRASDSSSAQSSIDINRWQYCHAASHAHHLVYISLPFPTVTHGDFAFAQMLRKVEHEAIQCSSADDEASISIMRQNAVNLNRNAGNTIVTWEAPQVSENIHTGKNHRHRDGFMWQYCLATSYAEKKVYVSPPFPKDTDTDIATTQTLHQDQPGTIESTFGEMLSQSEKQHDAVQCPIGKDERSISRMREHAINFNHNRGYTIITRNWKP
jgi:hypothetical protein